MQTIDITTTQNVTIEYEVAGMMDRFLALMLDIFVMITFTTIVGLVASQMQDFADVFSYSLILPFLLFYSLISEIMMNGQSLGKKALGLKVVKLSGAQPTANDYVIRWSFRLVDIWLSLGTLGSLFITSSSKGQRLGDLVADTAVIKEKSNFNLKLEDILRISTLDNHEVTYQDVRQFSERDMLLIKNVITRFQKYPNAAHRDAVRQTVTHMVERLNLNDRPKDHIKFLKTLISDYIVLTR